MLKLKSTLALTAVCALAACGTSSQPQAQTQAANHPQPNTAQPDRQQCVNYLLDGFKLATFSTGECKADAASTARYNAALENVRQRFVGSRCPSVVAREELFAITRADFERVPGRSPQQYCAAIKHEMPQIEQRYRSR